MKWYFIALLAFCPVANAQSEKQYQQKFCEGQIEVVLDDRTRVDCLTDTYAIEYDFANKWKEAIGQSLHYAKKTGKKAGIVLIMRKRSDNRYYNELNELIDHYELPIYTWQIIGY